MILLILKERNEGNMKMTQLDNADLNARIEKFRKDNFTIKFTGAKGKTLVGES